MAKLPPLSADGGRNLQLQFEELDEKLGFAGGVHRRRLDSPEKRRKALDLLIGCVDEDPYPYYYYRLTGAPIRNDSELKA